MQARQQADSFEAEVSDAAGQAAEAWALVEAMEAKGDAAAAADKAAQAVALQQQYQERQAAADAAASQAQQQVHTTALGACYSTACMATSTHHWSGPGRYVCLVWCIIWHISRGMFMPDVMRNR